MVDRSHVFEKLGLFYLGQRYDLESRTRQPELVLYDSRDLVTHAFCVGMTGSGKTGLGIALLEEAAIDGIPALVIDPKGDMTNILLAFPDLAAKDLAPWIHAEEAARAGISPEVLAEQKAAQWQQGLADWGQSTDRIRALKDACDFTIFTPGSHAGVPVSILSSFQAPAGDARSDADAFQDRVAITATSLLSLLGIDTDPIRSREHILLTTILEHCWQRQIDLDLAGLIRLLQDPPVSRVGVIDLETFFPASERFALAMSLNNLLAAPGFAAWLSGEPLDVHSLLYTPTGRPRVSIFYTAHLAEPERLFFTALLLNQTLGWMRSRPGTTSLRALLYIDELFGYLPPIGEPSTKRPLLTLLKQARAYGLGIVLATQNPVDLDYKGLSNMGTWFLGRLQTERDKERVLDGLEGAASGAEGALDRRQLSDVLSALGHRVFLMHNVHEAAPVIFQSRWALSYLAGPMTRDQIRILMASKRAAATTPGVNHAQPEESKSREAKEPTESVLNERPLLPPDISELFLPPGTPAALGRRLTYRPHLVAWVQMHYVDPRKSISADETLLLLTPLHNRPSGIDWSQARELGFGVEALLTAPPAAGDYAELPSIATLAKSYTTWSKALSDHLYRTRRYRRYTCEELQETSVPGEDEREFRLRLGDRAREERDRRAEELRVRYAGKLESINNRIRMAQQRVERERQEASGARMQSMISLGNTVLQMVLGRKRLSTTTMNRATTAARGASRAAQQADDVRRAEENLEAYQDQLLELEEELQAELRSLEQRLHVLALRIEERPLKPRRQDVDVRQIALAWVAD